MTRRTGLPGLLLAGAAAYGLYKLSKLSADERSDLVNKGKKFVSDNLSGLKDKFSGGSEGNENGQYSRFSEEASYH